MPATASNQSSPRDSAHRSNSAARPFPSSSAAVRLRRATHETAPHAEKVNPIWEGEFDNEGTFESEVPCSDYDHEALKHNKIRRLKVAQKERGSFRRALRDDVLPFRNRNRNTPAPTHAPSQKPERKLKRLKENRVGVFIPGVVSVGNLARILGVSLSEPYFVRQYSVFSLPR
jgi:hypothetical protein